MISRLGRTGTAAAWVATMGLLALGCSNPDEQMSGPAVPKQPEVAPLMSRLEVSTKNAAAGERIALAIDAKTDRGTLLGGVQGVLKYDPSLLRFIGQAEDKNAVALVGAGSEGKGLLAVASLNVTGLPERSAVLYFQVKGAGYTRGLDYRLAAAALPDNHSFFYEAKFTGVAEAADLAVARDARRLGLAEWEQIVDPSLYQRTTQLKRVPGDTLPVDLKFGDADLSGAINIFDALYVANTSVGNNQLISGTNAPARDAVVAGNVVPGNANLNLCGVNADGTRSINIFDALEIANASVGNTRPCPGNIIPGHAAGPVGGKPRSLIACPTLASRTLTNDTIYELPKPASPTSVCFIGDNSGVGAPVVLTVQQGTRIESDSNTLVISRGAKIQAVGTFLEPIVFTCKTVPATVGCWGGMYVNGNAPINNGTATSPAIRNSAGGCLEQAGEGGTGNYGGCDPNDDSGTIKYVIVTNGGTRFSPTNERNGFTFQGVGNTTLVDYLNSDNGLDDGIEWFGGTVNVKHVYVNASQDDGLDWVAGWVGKVQFYIVRGCPVGCDRGIEADNFGIDPGGDPEALPRSNPTIYNFTAMGQALPITSTQNFQGMELRQNTAGTIRNFALFNYKAGIDIDQQANVLNGSICTQIANGNLTVRNGFIAGMSQGAGDPDGADPIDASFGPGATGAGTCGPYTTDGTNLEALLIADPANAITVGTGDATTHLVDPFGLVPDFRVKSTSPLASLVCATPPNDGFFDPTATFCGAIKPGGVGEIPWYSGWTLPRH